MGMRGNETMMHNFSIKFELFLSYIFQIRYNLNMNTIYVSNKVNYRFDSYLEKLGYKVIMVFDSPYLNKGISSHPDLFMCKLGCQPESAIFFGNPKKPKDPYPHDVIYNAVCTGKYFIHNLALSDKSLLQKAREMDMILIDVHQGYTKCNMVVVDDKSMITSDEGIYKTLIQYPDIDCLLVQPGFVSLPGFSTGFIGGTSGRIGSRVIFHGNLKYHPEFNLINQFIKYRGLETVWFEEFSLTDIGSVIEEKSD
jgi:hypothetical protein